MVPVLVMMILAVSFLSGPPVFAGGEIKGRTEQSALYEKTKNRYYRPTALPEFKLEWPHFELGEIDEAFEKPVKSGGPSSSGEEEMPILKPIRGMSPDDIHSEMVRLTKLSENRKRDLDAEIAYLEKG